MNTVQIGLLIFFTVVPVSIVALTIRLFNSKAPERVISSGGILSLNTVIMLLIVMLAFAQRSEGVTQQQHYVTSALNAACVLAWYLYGNFMVQYHIIRQYFGWEKLESHPAILIIVISWLLPLLVALAALFASTLVIGIFRLVGIL